MAIDRPSYKINDQAAHFTLGLSKKALRHLVFSGVGTLSFTSVGTLTKRGRQVNRDLRVKLYPFEQPLRLLSIVPKQHYHARRFDFSDLAHRVT